MKKQFTFAPFKITVSNSGHRPQPFASKETCNQDVPRYRVTVTDDSTRYSCYAYGSIDDSIRGREDNHKKMAAMVLDELCSAYCDPNEFAETATSGTTGMNAKRLRAIADVIDFGKSFGEPLIEAVNKLREDGEL